MSDKDNALPLSAAGARLKNSKGARGLSREAIAEEALALMEESGDSGFTIRKLAARMGYDPMSILYHFKSKDGVLRAMADRMEEQIRPAPPDRPWRGRMRHLADQYRSLALRYPNSFWLMQKFLHTGHADFLHMEMVHGALTEAGIAEREIPALCLGWYGCITGLAVGETGGLIRPAEAVDMAEVADLPEKSYPLLKKAMPLYNDLAPSTVFSLSVEVFLDGIRERSKMQSL
ncbi:TetR/AcrR family transcriptional regulator [Paenochrobactrum pullorum]|uniref:TetR/AcrR family transcriptional regulator n=1 Tax=Paenochrobactrum pullorum TaxID=1324351 RepID=UPI0035BC1D41